MNLNEFVRNYYGHLASGVYADPYPVSPEDTALVLIDAQDMVSRSYYEDAYKAIGAYTDDMAPILDELEAYIQPAIDNIGKVLTACREKGIRPIHVKIQAYLPDAADTGRLHKSANMLYPPGMRETNFIKEAMPLEGEIVLTKTCSGIHVGTQIDRVLRNLGITTVLVVGFYTDQCVSTSVRDLSDLGYKTQIIEDAIAAFSPERHEMAMNSICRIYANSETTASLVDRLSKM